MDNEKYHDLKKFAKSVGIPPDNLVKAFEIEKIFHKQILKEKRFENRKRMYENVYRTVHQIYGTLSTNIKGKKNPFDRLIHLFKKELEGKSILDVGCGAGYFLMSVVRQLKHDQLSGIDISIPPLLQNYPEIQFICGDIIDFYTNQRFDVVFSHHVLEHIAPDDLETHLKSIKRSLKRGGLFIVILPNYLFGPSDVTRIKDFSYTGKTKAQGTHLNETTYSDLIPILKSNGFGNFKTVFPIPKVKYLFPSFRIKPSILMNIEKNKIWIKFLHSIRFNRQCVARLGITLICTHSGSLCKEFLK